MTTKQRSGVFREGGQWVARHWPKGRIGQEFITPSETEARRAYAQMIQAPCPEVRQ